MVYSYLEIKIKLPYFIGNPQIQMYLKATWNIPLIKASPLGNSLRYLTAGWPTECRNAKLVSALRHMQIPIPIPIPRDSHSQIVADEDFAVCLFSPAS